MDIDSFDFGSLIRQNVGAVLAERRTSWNYSHEDLWRLVQAWYDNAESQDNATLGQCAYELSAMIGPLAYAATPDRVQMQCPDWPSCWYAVSMDRDSAEAAMAQHLATDSRHH